MTLQLCLNENGISAHSFKDFNSPTTKHVVSEISWMEISGDLPQEHMPRSVIPVAVCFPYCLLSRPKACILFAFQAQACILKEP